jgi:hypothetical protein
MLLVPKPLQYLVAWVVATSVGVGVALLGVRVVLESTSPRRPSLVKAPEAIAVTGEVSGATRHPGTPRPTARGVAATPTPSTATPRPSPSRPNRPGPPRSTGTPRPANTVQLCDDRGTDDGAFIQSYEMYGGRAAVRYAPGRVCLVSAAPRTGHVVTVSPERPDRLVVRFQSRAHSSELVAMWLGVPIAQSREIWR